MAVLMAVSLSPQAEIPSAFAGGDAARAAQTAAKQGTVDVGLSLGSGSITVNGQTLKAPSSQITIPNTKDFTFTASAGSAATLTAVNLTHGQNSTPLSPDSNGVYTVAQEQLVEGVGIELETEASTSASAEESAPTAFTKKAPSAQTDAAASSSSSASSSESSSSNALATVDTLAAPAASTGISVSLQFKDANGAPVAAPDLGGQYLYAYVADNNNANNHVLLPLVAGSNGYAADVTGMRTGWWPETLSDLDPQGTYTVTLCTFGDGNQGGYASGGTALSNGGLIAGNYIVSLPASGTVSPGGQYAATATAFGPAGSDEYTGILGDAIDYGITTGSFTLEGGDAESNVAARVGTCTTQTGNDLSNPTTQTMLIGEIQNKFVTKGYSVYFRTSPESADKVLFSGDTSTKHVLDTSMSKDALQAEVQGMLDNVAAKQAELAAHPANAAVVYKQNDQRYVLDIKGRGAGTYYVNLDSAAFKNALSENGKFKIYKDDDQTIVFNVTATGDVSINQFYVNDRASGNMLQSDAGDTPQQIIWNFTGASKVTTAGSVTGVFLATGADWYNDNTSSGWLVAKSVFIRSGEWHNVYQHNKQYNGGTGSLAATKHVNGADATVSGFKFKLEEQTAGGWQQVGDLVANNKSAISFGPIAYTDDNFAPDAAGGNVQTHVYRITEDPATSAVDGVAYGTDATAYYAKIVVHKFVDTLGNTTNTTYVAEPATYYADEACSEALPAGAVFNNTSSSKVQSELLVKKAISGRAWQDGDAFQFTLTAQNGAPMPEGSADGTKTVTATSTDAVSFGQIVYDVKDAVYTYTIKETAPAGGAAAADLAYDTTEHTATVTVKDGVATVAYDGAAADALTVTNTYAAKTSIAVTKNYNKWKEGQTFGFTLTAVGNDAGVKTPMTAATTATATQSQPTASFGEIAFTKEGTYTYSIQENLPEGVDADHPTKDGITYAVQPQEVKVVVAMVDGKLTATPQYGEGASSVAFTNTYNATGALTLGGTKTFENGNGVNTTFTYTVKEGDATVATGTSNGAGAISFTTISYGLDDLGAHTYTVTEDKGGTTDAGITYDSRSYTVKVNVTDNGNGTLAVAAEDGSAALDGMNFKNTYQASGEATIDGHKQVTGKSDADLSGFAFTLTQVTAANDTAPAVEDGTQLTATSDANGDFSFDKISYTAPGTYYYKVSESGSKDGYTAQTSAKYVTVTVTDTQHNGAFDVDVAGAGADLTFTNTYRATGALNLSGTKAFTNGTLTGDDFSFQLKEGDTVLQTVKNNANGTFAFSPIVYATDATDAAYQPGEHTYTVSEVAGSAAGVTYDDTVYTVKVNVTDKGDGTLAVDKVEGTDFNAFKFTNAFTKSGSVQLQANKTLNGAVPDSRYDGKFSFELKDADGKVLQTKQNGADGTVAFDKIDYTAAGTYTYTIDEVVPADADKLPGVTYDTSVVNVTVTVANENGTLVATPTYTYGDGQQGNTFKNTYSAKGSITLAGTKTFENQSLTDDEFSFVATENGTQVATGTNKADGSIAFTPIDYAITANDTSALGEHTYKVSEVTGDKGGITYDANSKTVKVNVTDNGNGTLDAQVVSNGSDELSFTNTYTAKGSIKLTGTKSLTGRDAKAGEFGFTVKDEAGKVVATGSNGANGAITFTPISYTQADLGDHTYKVTEDQGNLGGVSYDQTEKTVVVHVADNGDGILSAAVVAEKSQAIAFSNTYTATGEAQFTAHKQLSGRTLAKGEFSFQLKEGDKLLQTNPNDADGNVAFDKISYSLADVGTHTYTISEVKGAEGGVTYDTAIKTVTVSVADNGDGTLAVTTSGDGDAATFTNAYTAAGDFTLQAAKHLDGRAFQAGDSWTFTVSGSEGAPLPATKQVTIDPTTGTDAAFSFGDIHYTLDDAGKTYVYKIAESGTVDGVTNDGGLHEVDVTVADKGDGTLSVTPVYKQDNGTVGGITFTNTYKATETGFTVSGTKTLEGRDIVDGEFQVALYSADDTFAVAGTDPVATASVASDGTYALATPGDLIGAAGTYHYVLKEVDTNKPGVTYDDTAYNITVTATDDGHGQIKAAVSGVPDGGANFSNTYTKGTAVLKAKKTLDGAPLKAGAFSFQLLDADGNVLQTATNAADGNVSFEPLSYGEAGDYHYTIREAVPEGATQNADGTWTYEGTTYDGASHDVTVRVTTGDDGAFKVAYSYDFVTGFLPADEAPVPAFHNAYHASGSTTVQGHKTVNGQNRSDLDGKVAFELSGSEGAPLPEQTSVTTDANGDFSFGSIAYTEADAGKTYTYTVAETAAPSGYTLAAPQTFKVTVSDNGDGTLAVTSTAGKSGLAFDDAYAATGSAHFAAKKQLDGASLKAGAFTFTLSQDGTVLQTKQNDDNGGVAFDDVSYSLNDLKNADGTYAPSKDFHYQIAEAVPAGATQNADGTWTFAGVTYDGSVQDVTVHVADNGDGALAVTYNGDANTGKVFTNSYKATGEAALSATKQLTGAALQAGAFSFQLKDAAGTVPQTVSNDASGLAVFAPISYTAAGTYHYTINEVAGSDPDMTYDSSVKDVQVNVADNGDGTMSVTYGADKAATFAAPVFGNTHNAKGQATVTAKKVLEGAQLQADQFSFQLKDEAGNVLQTATNAADGTVAFAPLSYELSDLGGADAKDFHYTVSEVAGTNKGMTYDGSVKDVTVHVALDKASGTLATSVTFAGNDATFTNTYKADGAAYLAAHKQLDGKALEAGAFSFELKDADGNVLQAKQNDADGTVTFDKISYTQDVLKNADGTYKDSATYTYTVSEQIPEGAAQNVDGTYVKDGVTYDGHSEQVTVHVADRGNGTLAVTYGDAQVEQAPAITFVNNYRADATTAQLEAQKQLQGRSWVDGETFTFEMKALTEGAPMPESTTAAAAAPANGAATSAATFGTMTFDKAGSYDYLITEQVPEGAVPDGTGLYELNGITYDASAHKATVDVTDDGQGKLQATVTYDGKAAEAPVFTNEYKAADTTAVLSGTKTLTGGTLEAGAYTFQIEATGDAAADTPLPAVTAVTNAADGSFAFDAITYKQPGTYTYAISEVVPADAVNADGVTYAQATDEQKAAGGFTEAGVTYDTAVRTATVTVTDNQKGALEATVAYGTDAGLAFTNTKFEAHAALAFDKYYYGSDLNRAFSFSLVATDSSWNPRSGGEGVVYSGTDAIVDDGQAFTAQVTNPAFDAETHKATVALPDLTYYKAGTYRYLLHENADSAASDVVDDASVYQITVTVGADQKVSTSIARVTGEATAQPVTTATFYNNSAVLAAFRAMGLAADVAPEKDGAATFMPEVQKDFDGSLADNTFTFEMVDENGNAVSHGVNDATGHVALDMPGAASADTARDAGSAVLTYTEEGTYTYTIREVAADNALISYDKGTVELTVTVTKDDNGVLTAEGAYTKHAADGTTVEGNNTFTNETRAIDLRVQKNSKSNGAPLEGARYGLWQYNPNGQDVYLGNNMSDKNGWITFRDVKVQPGTAYYFKEEAAPAGHLVNPYRDPYFALVPDNANGYKLVYEGSAAFAQAVPAAANQREGA
jgi:pilin isopeptide linkage protein